MNEQNPIQEMPPRRRGLLWLLTLPLLACVLCAALSIYALMPLRGKILDRFSGRMIPVTGEEPAATDQPAAPASPVDPNQKSSPQPNQKTQPGAQAAPGETPQPGAESASPSGSTYRDTLDQRLETCTVSFHAFLMLEQVAIDQPDTLTNISWRSHAKEAAGTFHDDCQAIGTLPAAPSAYSEVDQLLKKAAAEVQPATDDFIALLDASAKGDTSMDKARSALRHMANFIHYTQHAEDVLSGLDDMKKI